MRTTVELDDELVRTAQEYCRGNDLSALLNAALRDLIHMEPPSDSRAPEALSQTWHPSGAPGPTTSDSGG